MTPGDDKLEQALGGSEVTKEALAANERANRIIVQLLLVTAVLVLAIVIGIGVGMYSLQREIKRQTISNAISNLEHRIRQEECVVQYIQEIAIAAGEDRPLHHLPRCTRESIPKMEKELHKSRLRLERET